MAVEEGRQWWKEWLDHRVCSSWRTAARLHRTQASLPELRPTHLCRHASANTRMLHYSALPQDGGGLVVQGGVVTLTHSDVSGCSASGSSEAVRCTEGVSGRAGWVCAVVGSPHAAGLAHRCRRFPAASPCRSLGRPTLRPLLSLRTPPLLPSRRLEAACL